jgi:hypothetical protein
MTYESAAVRVHLAAGFEIVDSTLKEPFAGTLSLTPAAEMAVVLEGVLTSLPYLLSN